MLSGRLRQGIPGPSALPTPGGGRGSECLLECPGKGGLGIVTDALRHLRQRCAGVAQIVRGDMHTPIGEIMHRGLANQTAKAIRQRRSGQPDFAPQFIDGPGTRDVAVEQSQRPRHVRVAQTREPAGLVLGQRFDVPPHSLDEQQLGQLRQHRA